MRTLLLTFILFQSINLYSQEYQEETLFEKGDTIYSVSKVFTKNNKLSEKRYIKDLKNLKNLTKDESFMMGKLNSELDSIEYYVYDKKWRLIKSFTVNHKDSIRKYSRLEYSNEEFEISKYFLRIEGKSNIIKNIDFELDNLTPQNYELKVKSKQGDIIEYEKSYSLKNRSSKNISLEVKINHGIKQFELIFTNSNNYSKSVKVETIGYDVCENDFKAKITEVKEISIDKNLNNLFFEIKGKEKLMIIKNNRGERKVPVSNLINSINKEEFEIGINEINLIDLSTGIISYGRIRIEK